MSSSVDRNSKGFGITIHHEGQTAENSIVPSPYHNTGDSNQQTICQNNNQSRNINEDEIKNNKP